MYPLYLPTCVYASLYIGTIYDPHDLRSFPFDENIINMTFVGNITRDGRHADAKDYILIPFNSKEKNDLNLKNFNFITAYKEVVDSLPEFFIVGTILSHYIKSTKHFEIEYSNVEFGIVLRRNYYFYFFKVILLLWMVAFLFTSIFGFKTVRTTLLLLLLSIYLSFCFRFFSL